MMKKTNYNTTNNNNNKVHTPNSVYNKKWTIESSMKII